MDEVTQRVIRLINSTEYEKPANGQCQVSEGVKSDLELLDAYSRAVIAVVDAVGPAVVGVSVGKRSRGRELEQSGAGSGVIIAPDGYILTNDHVVHNAEQLNITLTNGVTLPAAIAGMDPATDLA
ncbi:MAG TPA: trypsin-like peptidase domain-containing protein, partial [Thermodesulfovibrionales bacterium]|nr:trypsin-like peptidase domain-containing protein [Thermodesulfovibrionales bacterium]